MPVVSVNLSPRAVLLYEERARRRDASRWISQAMCFYANASQNRWRDDEPEKDPPFPFVQFGDRRLMNNGQWVEWTDGGWRPLDGL